jgi:hypothetical protein
MIPAAYIQEWSLKVAWPAARQVEQDLIICRALCDLFNSPALSGKIAFRGGTAINKLLFGWTRDVMVHQIESELGAEALERDLERGLLELS